ncbi:BppU family phage baseplate upper protein [Paenibacillus sp. 2RAB27]|uniref:hypothetical protein n=1 Tax=Paenibacillus sp. 2RAB27 TaxID=3232991 RepID=UPI003F99D76B
MATIYLKQNDTHTPIRATLRDPEGEPVPLVGAVVGFYMSKNGSNIVAREADILDAAGGRVIFNFQEGETSETGTLQAEFKVNFSDGTVETFPNNGYLTIIIDKELSSVPISIDIINGGTFLDPDFSTEYNGGVF